MNDEDTVAALAECEQENRLLRARNERLMIEVQLLSEAVRDLSARMEQLKDDML